ncbi:lipopolysaccharide biosynthesis protein [Haloarcula laminariae]|uniref:lipopolysaccharide biosynthesis protein n=1 Tax=Haloarcula laminariae TaxID=2961577 RepID=UPI0024074F8D|nr:polysaccharide biosynthesis C-terminal domain-containing protein [Halomicroarcula sp. FL173]
MSNFDPGSILKQLLGNSGFGALGQIASFVGVIAYTQLVPRSVLGSYFLLVAVLQIASFVGVTGVSTDITRRLNKEDTPGRTLSTATVFTLGVTVVLVIAAVIASPIIDSYVGNGFNRWLAVLLPVTVFALLSRSVLQGEQKNARAAGLVAAQRVTTYAVGSGSLLAGLAPAVALGGALFCGRLLVLVAGIVMVDVSLAGLPTVGDLRRLAGRALDLTAAGLGNLGQEWVDTFLIGVFLTPGAVALYEIAWRLSAVGLLVTNPVVSVLYPRFAAAVDAGNHGEIRAVVRTAVVYLSAPMLALFAGAVAVGPDLITVLYGRGYAGAYVPLVVLLAGRLPYSLYRLMTVLSYSYDRDRGVTRASLAAGLLNAVVNVLLIPLIGILGAAVASVVSFAVLAVLLFRLVADRMHYPSVGQSIPSVIAAAVMFVAVRLVGRVLPTTLLSVLATVVIGATLFTAVFVLVSPALRRDLMTLVGGRR